MTSSGVACNHGVLSQCYSCMSIYDTHSRTGSSSLTKQVQRRMCSHCMYQVRMIRKALGWLSKSKTSSNKNVMKSTNNGKCPNPTQSRWRLLTMSGHALSVRCLTVTLNIDAQHVWKLTGKCMISSNNRSWRGHAGSATKCPNQVTASSA